MPVRTPQSAPGPPWPPPGPTPLTLLGPVAPPCRSGLRPWKAATVLGEAEDVGAADHGAQCSSMLAWFVEKEQAT